MSTQTPHPQPAPPWGEPFFHWLRGLGMVRGDERWLAGVCGAVSARTGLDPLIVRGIAVVAGILGAPVVLLYVAGWVLLPSADGGIIAENTIRGRVGWRGVMAIVLLALLIGGGGWGIAALSWPGHWGWPFVGSLWTVLIVGGIVAFLVVQANKGRNAAGPRPAQGSAPDPGTGPGAGVGGADLAADPPARAAFVPSAEGESPVPAPSAEEAGTGPAGDRDDVARPAAPSGGATGAQPSAADAAGAAESGASDPGGAQWRGRPDQQPSQEWNEWARKTQAEAIRLHRQSQAPAGVILIGIGLILLISAVVSLVWQAIAGGAWFPGAMLAGSATAVVLSGLFMIGLGIAGRRAGGVATIAILATAGIALSSTLPTLPSQWVVGSSQSLSSSATGQGSTVVVAGNVTVDASTLPVGQVTRVAVLAGKATISIPGTGQFEIRSRALLGSVDADTSATNADDGGIAVTRTITISDGVVVAAAGSAPTTTIDVSVALGSVVIRTAVEQ